MPISIKMNILAIHGEGDQTKVNNLARYSKSVELGAGGRPVPIDLVPMPDLPPNVQIVAQDPNHSTSRVQIVLATWDEVNSFKVATTWDPAKGVWIFGAPITVTIG